MASLIVLWWTSIFRVGCLPAVYAIPLKYGHLPILFILSTDCLAIFFIILFYFSWFKRRKWEKEKRKIFYIPWEKPFSPSRSCDAMMIKINKYTWIQRNAIFFFFFPFQSEFKFSFFLHVQNNGRGNEIQLSLKTIKFFSL